MWHRFASAAVTTVSRVVAPFDGWIERVYMARGGVHDSENIITIDAGATPKTYTMVTGGAAGDVDAFENVQEEDTRITAGTPILIGNAGTPTESTQIAVYLVIRGL